jgi:hypothetical protein
MISCQLQVALNHQMHAMMVTCKQLAGALLLLLQLEQTNNL